MQALVATEVPIYGPNGYEGTRTVFTIKEDATPDQKRCAIDSLEALLIPCGGTYASKEIIRLRGLTKMREGDGAALSGASYVAEVGRYPADAVRRACKKIADRSTFFPSWAEFKTQLDYLVRPIKDALNVLYERGRMRPISEPSRELFEKIQRRNLDRMLEKHQAGAG